MIHSENHLNMVAKVVHHPHSHPQIHGKFLLC